MKSKRLCVIISRNFRFKVKSVVVVTTNDFLKVGFSDSINSPPLQPCYGLSKVPW